MAATKLAIAWKSPTHETHAEREVSETRTEQKKHTLWHRPLRKKDNQARRISFCLMQDHVVFTASSVSRLPSVGTVVYAGQ